MSKQTDVAWREALRKLYGALPENEEKVLAMERMCLEEHAREEVLACLNEAMVTTAPFNNPAVSLRGHGGTEVVFFVVPGPREAV